MRSFLISALKRLKNKDSASSYEKKVANEINFYAECENVHDLPDIFHYWSNKYLLPIQQKFGYKSPDDFFVTYIKQYALENKFVDHLKIVSIGSGNGELEVNIAKEMKTNGIENFAIECVDINHHMLERTLKLAQEMEVEDHIKISKTDFNQWQPEKNKYDIVMANQSLHHVLNLEGLFNATNLALKDDGSFITSDMIGRNGHQRWPEALELLKPFWAELPEKYKYNQLLQRKETGYINHDCSTEGFEGIRAQDILPMLVENFNFELFIPFANIIMVFIDRPFGHNFDANSEWDLDFIDRVHAADEQAILDGIIKPTQMLAVMKKRCVKEPKLRHEKLTPEFCIRNPNT